MRLNINTDSVIYFTNKLEKMSSRSLPISVQRTLNNVVFDVKTNTMPKESNRAFVNRSQNFFKANSRYEKASGNSIHGMRATVGFVNDKLKGTNNYAVEDLEQQEHGGTIKGRSFIPLNQARQGGNYKGIVKPGNRIGKINNLIRAGKIRGKNKEERFIKAALKAKRGGYVLGSNQIVYKINSFKTKSQKIKAIPLYKFKKRGTVNIKTKTHFMENASMSSASKLEMLFIKEAKKQIERIK